VALSQREMTMTITDVGFHDDAAGFWSRECPSCERTFKVKPDSSNPKAVKFCPYCEQHGEDCWGTAEQVRYIERFEEYAGAQAAIAQGKEKTRTPAGTRAERAAVKPKAPRTAPDRPTAPDEPDSDMPTVWFDCCEESVCHDGNSTELRCPFCGETPD